jgi:hypothetical protein
MIDEGLPEAWPEAVTTAALAFQQGDMIRNPPFFYTASSQYGVWALTRETGDPDFAEELFELEPNYGFPFGMIATETCDLTEEDRRYRKHPWLSVAPVYAAGDAIDPDTLSSIKEGRYAYLRSVESEALGAGVWVVDARILIPIEKSWLVGKFPIRVYATADERAAVANFFAERFRRVDLSPKLHTALIKPLRRWLEHLSASRLREVMGYIKEVRLAISGDPLNPDGASIILLVDDKAHIDEVRAEWDRKWESWQARMEEAEIALLANAYETYDSLSARGYCESLPIDVSFN